MEGTFVAYYRVSTDRQGRSGLGLEAQKEIVADYLNGGNWTLAEEFVEVETGSDDDRPELAKALALCKRRKATLIVAKLDRLSRDLAFIATLMKSKARFVVAEMPRASKFELHARALFSEHERDMISARTKAALQALKRRGVKLGSPQLDKARRLAAQQLGAKADQFASTVVPHIEAIQRAGITSCNAIAKELNARNIKTARGGTWTHVQVAAALRRKAQ